MIIKWDLMFEWILFNVEVIVDGEVKVNIIILSLGKFYLLKNKIYGYLDLA